jgi:alpha-galactosidase
MTSFTDSLTSHADRRLSADNSMPLPPGFSVERIQFDSGSGAFFLHAADATYVGLHSSYDVLNHVYWGPRLACQDVGGVISRKGRAFSPNPVPGDPDYSLDTTPQEYPAYGRSDFRSPALEILHEPTGSRIVDLRYAGHRIEPSKPRLAGLPATFTNEPADAETLVVTLRDDSLHLTVELSYTAFAHHPVITRSAVIRNEGVDTIKLTRALSCSLDFPSRFSRFHFVNLHGTWLRERHITSAPLRPGSQSIESRRGASSHAHNPFFALTEYGADEEHGAAYGFNLLYSGNFLASAELDSYGGVRAQIGLNPFDFSWELEPGASFQTPEAVLAFSNEGLGGMSRAYHRFYRQHLISPKWRDRERPVVMNSWEPVLFDFDADTIEALAREAAPLGAELFVLDDGWFGHRDNEKSSLGDWVADERKLPGGLADLVRRVQSHGLDFGLWFEPEMISPDSDLYRAHPDWCLHVPTHSRTEGRYQYVLDLSRPEVCEEIYRRLAAVLKCAPVSYVKWDMNRNMTEIGSATREPERQQETAHRYMLGLYGLLERLTREFPGILFEGCSGGGGRFDPGMLYYMPQIWTSDNSDAVSRLFIQYGTSVVYPLSSISAHVSSVPNDGVGRVTPLRTRGDVACTGASGYELDIRKLPTEEKAEIREQIQRYKEVRQLLLTGDLYRLRSPFESNEAAWMVVSADRREALVTHVTILAQGNAPEGRLPLRGLDPDGMYRVNDEETPVRGDFLIQVGLFVPEPKGDFISRQWRLCQV